MLKRDRGRSQEERFDSDDMCKTFAALRSTFLMNFSHGVYEGTELNWTELKRQFSCVARTVQSFRPASEEVTLKIIKSKRLPLLLYGLEVCPLAVSDLRSLDFVINRFFMKLFCTNVMDTVKICQDYFNFELPSSIIEKRRKTFVACCVPIS